MVPSIELACYGLMLLVAAAASWTDLRRRVIPNRLLLAGLVGAAALQGGHWAVASGLVAGGAPDPEETRRLVEVAVNGASGLVAGLALYWVGLWSAGDAKLAAVLALAQPAWVEVGGPVPWAPVLVLLGNGLVVALVVVVAELVARGVPRLVRAARQGRLLGDRAALAAGAVRGGRVALAMAALATSLGPIRSGLAERAGGLVSGGPFFTFLLLFVLYRPLRVLAMKRWGLLGALALLLLAATYSIWTRGEAGALEVGRSLLVAASVIVARVVLGLSSRSFDARRLPIEALRPGMVLAPSYIDRMEGDGRWQEAFAPIVGSLRKLELDANYIDNVREWHAHNAADEEVAIHAPLPFAPALAIAVVLTAWAGGILFVGP